MASPGQKIQGLQKTQWKWKAAFAVALINDVLDFTGIGAIPIIGDLIDLVASALLWRIVGTSYTIPTLLEFVPGLDIIPIYTATVSLAYYQREKE